MGKSAGPRFESKRPTAPADHGGGVIAKPWLPGFCACACALSEVCLESFQAPQVAALLCVETLLVTPALGGEVPPQSAGWRQCPRERRDQTTASDSYKKDS